MKTDFVPGAIYRLNRPMLLTRLDGKIGNARAWFAPASPQQIEAARSGQFSGSKVLGVVGQETKIRCQSLVYEDYFENQKIWPVGTITTGAFKGESVLLPVQSRRGIWEFEIDKEYLSQTE